jgi:hypothetical protein
MPTDAKLGLVIGVGLVIAVAVVFTRQDLSHLQAGGEKTPASAVHPTSEVSSGASRIRRSLSPAHTLSWIQEKTPQLAKLPHETVQEQDTLFHLVERCFREGERKIDQFWHNRSAVEKSDHSKPKEGDNQGLDQKGQACREQEKE